jgi:hypothetical protein
VSTLSRRVELTDRGTLFEARRFRERRADFALDIDVRIRSPLARRALSV